MNQNIQTLVDLARDLMDGQQPPVGQALSKVEAAVSELQKHQSPAEYELLGVALMGVLLRRVASEIHAAEALQKFIRGGDHA